MVESILVAGWELLDGNEFEHGGGLLRLLGADTNLVTYLSRRLLARLDIDGGDVDPAVDAVECDAHFLARRAARWQARQREFANGVAQSRVLEFALIDGYLDGRLPGQGGDELARHFGGEGALPGDEDRVDFAISARNDGFETKTVRRHIGDSQGANNFRDRRGDSLRIFLERSLGGDQRRAQGHDLVGVDRRIGLSAKHPLQGLAHCRNAGGAADQQNLVYVLWLQFGLLGQNDPRQRKSRV